MSALDPANHRAAAVEANHSTWKLLDGRTLSAVETDELLARAHAAAYHWARAAGAGPEHGAPASWPLSRRYAAAGHGELALNFADRCRRGTGGGEVGRHRRRG